MDFKNVSRGLWAAAMGVLLTAGPMDPAQAQTPGASPACVNALQGRIAWDHNGNTAWDPTNMERLCRGGAGDQPARCFQRVMSGAVSYGEGNQWEWENALNLCQGSRNAAATVGCFEGLLRTGRPWREAIAACGGGRAPQVAPAVPADPMAVCRAALQGRVAWDHNGNTSWAPANLDRLCRGGTGDQPARCFERLMSGAVSYGEGNRWEWENAVNLCHGSHDAAATVTCFEGLLRVGRNWREAIAACSR